MTQKAMFEAKCTSCGKTCTVPFKPTAGKPVYCRECFSKHNQQARERTSSTAHFDKNQAWAKRRTAESGAGVRREEGFSFTYAP